MAKKNNNMRIMPRRIRNRLGLAFVLMAVIPTMIGVSTLTNGNPGEGYEKYQSIAFAISLILAGIGLIMMKSAVWSLIDISQTINEVLSDYIGKNTGPSESEIIALDQLIIYMQNQIHQSRQKLDSYRADLGHGGHFKLPPMIPSQIMPQKTIYELEQAESNKYPITILAFEFDQEIGEDIPAKLIEFLKESAAKVDGMGQYNDKTWLLWQKKQSGGQGEKTESEVEEFFGPCASVNYKIFRHPIQGYDLYQIVAAIDNMKTGSQDA